MNAAITLDGALGGETFATSSPRDLAASEQPDFGFRADDVAPRTFGRLGELLYEAWG